MAQKIVLFLCKNGPVKMTALIRPVLSWFYFSILFHLLLLFCATFLVNLLMHADNLAKPQFLFVCQVGVVARGFGTFQVPPQEVKTIAGEIVPRRNRTQEKSYPNWMGTISLEKSYLGYDFSRDIVPKVRFLQRVRTLRLKKFNTFLIYTVNIRFSVLHLNTWAE